MRVPAPIIDAIKQELYKRWHIDATVKQHQYIKEWDVVSVNDEDICEIYQEMTEKGILVLLIQYEVDDSKGDEIRTKNLEWTYEYSNPNSFDLNKIVNQLYSIIMLHNDLMEDLHDLDPMCDLD
jgi:hypothetical protein